MSANFQRLPITPLVQPHGFAPQGLSLFVATGDISEPPRLQVVCQRTAGSKGPDATGHAILHGPSLGLFQLKGDRLYGPIGVLFGCFGPKIDGDSLFTWWFNHLPGPSIATQRRPFVWASSRVVLMPCAQVFSRPSSADQADFLQLEHHLFGQVYCLLAKYYKWLCIIYVVQESFCLGWFKGREEKRRYPFQKFLFGDKPRCSSQSKPCAPKARKAPQEVLKMELGSWFSLTHLTILRAPPTSGIFSWHLGLRGTLLQFSLCVSACLGFVVLFLVRSVVCVCVFCCFCMCPSLEFAEVIGFSEILGRWLFCGSKHGSLPAQTCFGLNHFPFARTVEFAHDTKV